jgi:hypothetical protein
MVMPSLKFVRCRAVVLTRRDSYFSTARYILQQLVVSRRAVVMSIRVSPTTASGGAAGSDDDTGVAIDVSALAGPAVLYQDRSRRRPARPLRC